MKTLSQKAYQIGKAADYISKAEKILADEQLLGEHAMNLFIEIKSLCDAEVKLLKEKE